MLVCDRIKSTLSESCLKYVLSVESSRDDGWLPIKELTECVDRFVAAKGDYFKPRAYAIGQTPQKSGQKSHFQFDKPKGQSCSPGPNSKAGNSVPKAAPDITTTPRKQIVCYECQKPGHV